MLTSRETLVKADETPVNNTPMRCNSGRMTVSCINAIRLVVLFVAVSVDQTVGWSFQAAPATRNVRLHSIKIGGDSDNQKSHLPILDFSRLDSIEKIDRLDDAIMGGISTSTVLQVTSAGSSYAKWFGVCRTEGGGFAGFRTNPFREPLVVPDGTEGLYLVARFVSDSEPERRVWKMSTRTERGRGEVVYQAPFELPSSGEDNGDQWARIEIPFTDFQLVRGPRMVAGAPPMNTTNGLFQIGMTMSKFAFGANTTEIENFRDGFFQLDLREIGFYSSDWTFPKDRKTELDVMSKQEAVQTRPVLLKVLSPALKVLFSEKSRRRKLAMKLLRESRGLSRLQAIMFGLQSRRSSKGVLSALTNAVGILAIDVFRTALSATLRICLVYPISLVFKLKNFLFGKGTKKDKTTTVAFVRYRVLTKIIAILRLLDVLISVKSKGRQVVHRDTRFTMAETFEICTHKYSQRTFFEMADGSGHPNMTYGQAEMASAVVATWAGECFQEGDVVAIMMPNSCEFVVAMFGLLRAGLQAALVNTSLKGASLVHALTKALQDGTSSPKKVRAVLVSSDLLPQLQSISLPTDIQIVECGKNCTLDPWIDNKPFSFHKRRDSVRWDDTCVYIYTSGTTGLPKASKINNLRMWSAGCVTKKLCALRAHDRLYGPLPLYHASGCTLGLVACLLTGSTFVTRTKFSASRFAADVAQHQCTACQYIGEMARYLVAVPPHPQDGVQPLRFAFGNGMPTEVWERFMNRYSIGVVNEFYAATEGNVNIFNNTGVIGPCGIIPRGFEWIYPIGLFRHDVESGDLVRDEKGLCIPCKRGEVGELLGLIKQNDPSRRFDGYTDTKATKRKVVENVKKQGDAYFRSGDLLKQDGWGFLYFVDRVGDTFRWKGENVSTSEVARTVVEAAPNVVEEAVVYGVEVPGCDGRAGMAALVVRMDVPVEWPKALWESLQQELPRYAQPVFLRVCKSGAIEKTSTQKYKKTSLQKESFMECGVDSVYVKDDAKKTYIVLTANVKDSILKQQLRL